MRVLVLLAGLLGGALAHAQGGAIAGTVRDAETGAPLALASVVLDSLGRGAATDAEGRYTVGGLAPGRYALRVSFVGYETARVAVAVGPGATARADVALAPGALGEITVTARPPVEEELAVGLQEVPIGLVERLPTAFEADLFRSIQLLPGVQASSDFSSALYVRGGSPDQTLIRLDGATVYNPTHFFGFFSTFNTSAIEDVRFYKGAYPSPYGGRLGAVVDVANRAGNPDRPAGSVSVGLLASRAGAETPFAGGRGRVMLAARRSTLEPLLAYLRETTEQEGIPESFYFYDLNGRVGFDATPRDRVVVSGYAGRDLVAVPFGDSRFDLDYGNRMGALAYRRVLSETAFAEVRATASHYFSRPTGEILETTFSRPNTITDYGGRADLEWAPSDALTLRTGAWGGYFDLRLRSEFNGQTGIDFRSPAGYGSGYVQARVRPTPGWIVTGGLRADYFASLTDDRTDADAASSAAYLRLAPHLQVERLLGPDAVAQVAVGRYNQFVSLISNEAFSGFDTWVTTGVGVPPMSSEQAVVGLKTRVGRAYRLGVEVYGRTLRDLFDSRPELQDVSGLDYTELFRYGEGYAYGVEVLAERGVGRLTGLVSYTLGVTRRRYPDEPAFAETFPPKYDRLHDLSAIASLDVGRGWRLTAAAVYSTGQAYTLPVGRYNVALPFETGGLDGLYSGRLNGQRLPPYHRLDLGVTKSGRLFGVADYEVQVQVVNAYDRRNVWFVQYDFDENPVERTEVAQLPRLPNVSFSLDF